MVHPYLREIQDYIDRRVHPLQWRKPETVDELKELHQHMPEVFERFKPAPDVIRNTPSLDWLLCPWQQRLLKALDNPRSYFARDVANALRPYREAS